MTCVERRFSGAANVARGVEGFQLSVVNVGGDVTGAQIGVVNVARNVRGTQFGLVNVADTMSGASLGLVTFVRDGIHELELAGNETGASTLSGLLGSRHVYTRLGVGWMPAASDIPGARTPTTTLDETGSRWLFQWGVGGRVQLHPRWALDVEVVGTQFHFVDENKNVLGSARALFNVRLAPQLALMFGPTFTTAVGWDGSDPVTSTGFAERVVHDGQTTVRMYPGFVAGLRI